MSYDDIVFNDTPTNLNKLTRQIEEWAIDRELDKQNPDKQVLKAFEEMGELVQAHIKGHQEELVKEIGDVYVTITILAQQKGLDIRDCIYQAHKKNRDRIGVIKDGVYVKSEDL